MSTLSVRKRQERRPGSRPSPGKPIGVLVLVLLLGSGCVHSQGGGSPEGRGGTLPTVSSKARAAGVQPAASRLASVATSSAPAAAAAAPVDQLAELRRLVEAELGSPELTSSRLSLVVVRLPGARAEERRRAATTTAAATQPAGAASQPATSRPAVPPLIEVAADAHRLPASNAKLLTTLGAAVLLPGRYRFVTEVSRSGQRGPLYLWGTGDPILRGADLGRMAAALHRQGVREVSAIVVDDSHFGRESMAPGFEAFSEGSHYRPTSGAINVDGNTIEIRVSAPADRPRRPRVDVTPPSDYVTVRKLVRYTGAKVGPGAVKAQVKVSMRGKAARLALVISGTIGRKAKPFLTRRAVPDPSLNAGWALRRALTQAGVKVTGVVRRGRRPRGSEVLARREHSLREVLTAANQHSDNLAAETLVRVMSFLPALEEHSGARHESAGVRHEGASAGGSWTRGLRQLRHALRTLGLTDFALGNGSGLHRRAWVTARTLVQLLEVIYSDPALRRQLLPTLAVAGKSGTLAPRLRGGSAEGHLLAKTGTLGGALALSGFVDPQGKQPLAFSLIVNGRSDRVVRERIDHVAELLARYARGLPLAEPASQPTDSSVEGESGEGSGE